MYRQSYDSTSNVSTKQCINICNESKKQFIDKAMYRQSNVSTKKNIENAIYRQVINRKSNLSTRYCILKEKVILQFISSTTSITQRSVIEIPKNAFSITECSVRFPSITERFCTSITEQIAPITEQNVRLSR